jgi:hypothetical protein
MRPGNLPHPHLPGNVHYAAKPKTRPKTAWKQKKHTVNTAQIAQVDVDTMTATLPISYTRPHGNPG